MLRAVVLGVGALCSPTRASDMYAQEHARPWIAAALEQFLETPIDLLQWSLARQWVDAEAVSGTEAFRDLCFTQLMTVAESDTTDVTEIYGAFADGRFVGYRVPAECTMSRCDSTFLFRAEDDAPAVSADWSPWTLRSVNAQCATSPTCTPPSGDPVTESDVSVRTAHMTSLTDRGQPGELRTWSTYDPRIREWYTTASPNITWSRAYLFAGDLTFGVTARVQLDSADGQKSGVLAVDFALKGMSAVLQQAVDECKPGVWAYVVETDDQHEEGRLLAMAVNGLGQDELDREAIGAPAADAIYPCVAASARLLGNQGGQLREGVFQTADGGSPGCEAFEGIALPFGNRGMNWMLVVGQPTSCDATHGEFWSYGECDVCSAGTVPLGDGRTCVRCADTEEPNAQRSACNCRSGFENFGGLVDWHPELSAELTAFGGDADVCLACDSQIFPLQNTFCPGGPKQHDTGTGESPLTLYPKPGWWLADVTAGEERLALMYNASSADENVRPLADLIYSCPVQSCEGARCRPNMTGLLCAQCVHKSDIKSSSGICVPQCKGGAAKYWRNTLLKFLLLTLVLRWKTGQLDVAIDGATVAHLTFFGQSLYLLGQFGRGDFFGFSELVRSTGASDVMQDNAPVCDFQFPIFQKFVLQVLVIPLYSGIILLAMFVIEQRTIRPVEAAAVRNSIKATGSAHNVSNAGFIGKQAAKLGLYGSDATQLRFFVDSAQFRRGHFEPAGMWWMVSCLCLKKKLERLAMERTLIELLMFHYMGITTIAFSVLVCREVTSGGVTYSLSTADLAVSCDTTEFMLLRLCACLVFVCYSLGFPLFIVLVSAPELRLRVRGKLGLQGASSSSGVGSKARSSLQQVRSSKFDKWCRVSNIFTSDHRGWMALLLWRRAFLVFVFGVSQSSNGQLYLPSGLGVDSRMLCFGLLVLYTVVQAHAQPYLLPMDNTLEVCILIALMFIMFADIALDRVFCTHCLGFSQVKLKTILVALMTLLVLFLVVMHKSRNKQQGVLAKAGLVSKTLVGSGSGAPETEATSSSELRRSMSSELRRSVISGSGTAADQDDTAICVEFGLTTAEVKAYRKAFKIIDADGSDEIDESELLQMFRLIGEPVSAEEVGDIFASVDVDGSGSLDFRELVGMLVAREQHKVASTEAFEAFRILAKLQAAAAGEHADGERLSTTDISVAGVIGVEGITQALNSLAIDELKHDTALMKTVATDMLRWMNGHAGTLGEVDSVGLDLYSEKMLQLVEGDDANDDSCVENPVL